MTTATCNGPNRLHFSTNGDGHETRQKEDSKEANTGRDRAGRFSAGNPGGPGNPHARRVAHFRKLVLETVTDQDLKEIVVTLILKAKEGDLAAARLLLAYTLGKPAEAVDPDRLDIEEWQLAQEGSVRPAQMQGLMATLPADKANELLEIVRPCVLEQQLIDPMLSGLAKMDRQDAAREARRAKKAEQRQAEPTQQPQDVPEQSESQNPAGSTTDRQTGEETADNKRGKPAQSPGYVETSGAAITDSKRAKPAQSPGAAETSGAAITDSKRSKPAQSPADVETAGAASTDSKRAKPAQSPGVVETAGAASTDSKRAKPGDSRGYVANSEETTDSKPGKRAPEPEESPGQYPSPERQIPGNMD